MKYSGPGVRHCLSISRGVWYTFTALQNRSQEELEAVELYFWWVFMTIASAPVCQRTPQATGVTINVLWLCYWVSASNSGLACVTSSIRSFTQEEASEMLRVSLLSKKASVQ